MVAYETHGEFKEILSLARSADRPICRALRELIALLDPGFVEIVWPKHRIASFGVGPKKMTQHYAYIAVQSPYVNLGFYRGASLSAPTKVLKGIGKELRHIKIRDLSAIRSESVAKLLREAIADRRPFESVA